MNLSLNHTVCDKIVHFFATWFAIYQISSQLAYLPEVKKERLQENTRCNSALTDVFAYNPLHPTFVQFGQVFVQPQHSSRLT